MYPSARERRLAQVKSLYQGGGKSDRIAQCHPLMITPNRLHPSAQIGTSCAICRGLSCTWTSSAKTSQVDASSWRIE
jgi:hypothetical protein